MNITLDFAADGNTPTPVEKMLEKARALSNAQAKDDVPGRHPIWQIHFDPSLESFEAKDKISACAVLLREAMSKKLRGDERLDIARTFESFPESPLKHALDSIAISLYRFQQESKMPQERPAILSMSANP